MECPQWLHAEAKSLWERIVPQLEAAGLIDQVDQTGLEMLCQLYAGWRQAERQLADDGLLVEVKDTLRLNPLARYADNCQKQMRSLMQQFGLTPRARGVKGGTGKDALDSFLSGLAPDATPQ
jgi:P27 family predicted phage terminase small subunit